MTSLVESIGPEFVGITRSQDASTQNDRPLPRALLTDQQTAASTAQN